MKKLILFTLLLMLSESFVYAQKATTFGLLKRSGEEIVFGFKLKKSAKMALLCRQKANKYLVYRFGTADRVEMQYPASLNALSWKLFRFSGYLRGGNPKDVLDLYAVSFVNKGTGYKIYQNDYGEDNSMETGVRLTINGREINLRGDTRSETGALSFFNGQEELLHNYWGEGQ